MFFTDRAQPVIDNALSVKCKDVEIITVYLDVEDDGRGRISRSARLGTRHASDGKRQDNNVQDFHSAKIQKLLKWRKTAVTAGRKNLLFSELYFTFVTIFRVRT